MAPAFAISMTAEPKGRAIAMGGKK